MKPILNEKYGLYRFQGYSMYPMLHPGDRLVVEKEPCSPLRPGDVVLVKPGPSFGSGFTAHRIIQVDAQCRFVTKGDNLVRPDPGLKGPEDILGRVTAVIRKNRFKSLRKGLYGRFGKAMARYSRRNLTPGLILSRLKGLKGLLG
ncbi:MAG: S24/S26 family peptidase [Pseudomonadota bacterium]